MAPPDPPSAHDPQYRLSSETVSAGVVVARVTGELDYLVTPQLRRELFEHVDGRLTTLVLDLAGVTLLSAAALEMLLALEVMGAAQGCELRIVVTTRAVRRPLTLTGLDERLRLYDSVAAALSGSSHF